jgi:hypothetical protein
MDLVWNIQRSIICKFSREGNATDLWRDYIEGLWRLSAFSFEELDNLIP